MASYGKKTQTDNSHLENLTSAKFVHIDGSKTPVTVRSTPGRCLRVVVNAKGIGGVLRNGTEVIASFATTTVEGTYIYAVYCNDSIKFDVTSGTGSITVAHEG